MFVLMNTPINIHYEIQAEGKNVKDGMLRNHNKDINHSLPIFIKLSIFYIITCSSQKKDPLMKEL